MSLAPKPFQLEFKTDRDNLNRWWSILLNFGRQKPEHLPFFKGGPKSSWVSECKDSTRGLADEKLQVALSNLLTTIASFCPNGTFQTITGEATSLQWIYNRVAKMCHIQIGGRHLVNAWDIKYDPENESPDIYFLRMKAAFAENLLAKDDKYHGEKLTSAEAFAPMSESLIVLRWLEGIHPALPRHIQDTKAALFTPEKPSFADIQSDLCELMEVLLQEIDQVDGASAVTVVDNDSVQINRMSSNYRRGGRGGYTNRTQHATKPWSQQSTPRTFKQSPAVDKLCRHCKTVGKDPSIYTGHDVEMCFDLFPEKRRSTGVRILSIPVHVDDNDQFDPEEAEAFFQAYKLNQGLTCVQKEEKSSPQ